MYVQDECIIIAAGICYQMLAKCISLDLHSVWHNYLLKFSFQHVVCYAQYFYLGNVHCIQSVQLVKRFSSVHTEEQPAPGMLTRIWNWFNTYYEEPVSGSYI